MNPSPVFSADGVGKIYRTGKLEVCALAGVNLEVSEGEFLAIAGPSGSGKTTLLNLMGCLDFPSAGEIRVCGTATSKLAPASLTRLRAKKIGFIFQTFNLIPTLSALENVEYPLLLLGMPPTERMQKARLALEKVGLKDKALSKPGELSGGQRQRVAIARAIVKSPAIVLADEPTANLDRKTAADILDLMLDINRGEKVTFVFSSHDPAILKKANRVYRLIDGSPDLVYYWPENFNAV